MSVRLVSTNGHPRPAYHDEWSGRDHALCEQWHPAESLQLNEQEEANGIAAFVADRILTFIVGIAVCLVSEIVILLIVKGAF